MIEVSIFAVAAIHETLRSMGITGGKGLRLVEKAGNLWLTLDSSTSDDRVVIFHSVPILIINKALEAKLGNRLIHVMFRSGNPDLVISPYTSSGCAVNCCAPSR